MMLLAASYYFYMSWNPELIVLIVGTTLMTYGCARWISRCKTPKGRKRALALGVTGPLLVLFFFKYFNFFSTQVTAMLRAFSLPVSDATLRVILPVGISFYTFQALSYVIDVYRGTIPAQTHLGYYALYISFFPQLVAGPIERSSNLMPQFFEEHTFRYEDGVSGLQMIGWGLFKKILVADTLATHVNFVYNGLAAQTGLSLIVATVLAAIQIYCDFSGYSDIAIGTARMLGFRLMKNFDSPYLARSVREFWRRWHISLSTWFTDYIYIPLGGNRVSVPRHCLNLLITFLISGLWHGANWTFVLWGALHGVYLVIGALTRPLRDRVCAALRFDRNAWYGVVLGTAFTFTLVCIGWVLFRANTLSDAAYIFSHCFDGIGNIGAYLKGGYIGAGVDRHAFARIVFYLALLAWFDIAKCKFDPMARLSAAKPIVRWTVYVLFICMMAIMSDKGIAARFIYFQF